VLCTALAHEAGIGELGRLGLIITPTRSPRCTHQPDWFAPYHIAGKTPV